MKGHKDEIDIDLLNDEELPPGSSTKEPKTSFTTAQAEELGQILGKDLSVPWGKIHRGLG